MLQKSTTTWLIIAIALFFLFYQFGADEVATQNTGYSVSAIMQGDATQDFSKVTRPREFQFPRDHGRHDDYRTEWWYFTGNLASAEGRSFGYQLTLFRFAMGTEDPGGTSSWRSRQVYMAHFALTDIDNEKFHGFERFNRAAAGLAGASDEGLKVWLDNWTVESPGNDEFPLRLYAAEQGIALELELEQGKPMVLQGDAGFSVKNNAEGNASYYYSFTRMPSKGRISIGEQDFLVQGLSWMDREWSSSALGPGQLGWDWFALQLSDQSELMLYRFRREDGKRDPHSYGVLVSADGTVTTLGSDDFEIEARQQWQSPGSKTVYPVAWQLAVPAHDIQFEVQAVIKNQEWDLSFRYWEGAVELDGVIGTEKVSGKGYVEMTGYGDRQLNAGARIR